MKLDWFQVARDVLLTLVATFVLAYAVVWVTGPLSLTAGTLLALGCLTLAFCVIGCLKREARFAHLVAVGIGVWLPGTILNASARGVPSAEWVGLATQALVPVAAAVAIGGGLSLLLVRPRGAPDGAGSSSSEV